MAAVSLRYFNVALSGPGGSGSRGHSPETHLIPNVLAVAQRGDEPLRIFGDDYRPRTAPACGTTLRRRPLAHLLALARARRASKDLQPGSGTGSPTGDPAACQDVTGLDIPAQIAGRRPGDPAIWSPRPTGSAPTWAGSRHGTCTRSWPTRAFAQAVHQDEPGGPGGQAVRPERVQVGVHGRSQRGHPRDQRHRRAARSPRPAPARRRQGTRSAARSCAGRRGRCAVVQRSGAYRYSWSRPG